MQTGFRRCSDTEIRGALPRTLSPRRTPQTRSPYRGRDQLFAQLLRGRDHVACSDGLDLLVAAGLQAAVGVHPQLLGPSTCAARRSRSTISSVDGIRGEWMS